MVPSSTIDIAADGERLMWGRFSLDETVHLGNFEFTADYFGGLSFHGLNSQRGINRVIPRSEKEGTKPPYVCPGCSNHTHGNNMINRCNVIK
jgi:hypothetical protein